MNALATFVLLTATSLSAWCEDRPSAVVRRLTLANGGGPTGCVLALAVTGDETIAVTTHANFRSVVWSLSLGLSLHVVPSAGGPAIAPDSSGFIASLPGGKAQYYSLPDCVAKQAIEDPARGVLGFVTMLPPGQTALFWGDGRPVRRWMVGGPVDLLHGIAGPTRAGSIVPLGLDNEVLVGQEHDLSIWDTTQDAIVWETTLKEEVERVCASGTGKLAAYATKNCEVHFLDVLTGEGCGTLRDKVTVQDCVLSSDDELCAVVLSSGEVVVYAVATQAELGRFRQADALACCAAFLKALPVEA